MTFLKANNPLYADVAVNEEWLEAAMANDAECLVEQQNDSDEQPNDAIQPIVDSQNSVANVASPNAPNEIAMDCSDSDDALLTAVHKLETIASQNGFTIHDVTYDGDCMFSADVILTAMH